MTVLLLAGTGEARKLAEGLDQAYVPTIASLAPRRAPRCFSGSIPDARQSQRRTAYPDPHAVFPNRVGMPEYFRKHGYWTASYGKTEHHYQDRNWDVQTTDHRRSPWRPDYDETAPALRDPLRPRDHRNSPHHRLRHAARRSRRRDHGLRRPARSDLSPRRPRSGSVLRGNRVPLPARPVDVPRSIFEQYDPANLVLNPDARGNWPGWAWKINQRSLPLITEEQRRTLLHGYLAATTQMDYQVGRLLDFLDTRSLWEDTVVIFCSDNGYSLCEHEAMYRQAQHHPGKLSVAMFIHAPTGGALDARCSRQVELQDLFPTLLDLCGLPSYPGYLSGRSITPLVSDPTRPWPHPAKSVVAAERTSYATAKVAQSVRSRSHAGTDPNTNMYLDHRERPLRACRRLAPALHPPTEHVWAPLLASLDHDFGFAVGQPRLFYPRNSTFAPDRGRRRGGGLPRDCPRRTRVHAVDRPGGSLADADARTRPRRAGQRPARHLRDASSSRSPGTPATSPPVRPDARGVPRPRDLEPQRCSLRRGSGRFLPLEGFPRAGLPPILPLPTARLVARAPVSRNRFQNRVVPLLACR